MTLKLLFIGIGIMVLLSYMSLTGSLFNILAEIIKTPMLLVYLSAIGLGLSSGVLAYTSLVKSSGPVVAVAVATLRKVVTVLLSYFVFPKPFTFIHCCSALLVLSGILISSRPRPSLPGRVKSSLSDLEDNAGDDARGGVNSELEEGEEQEQEQDWESAQFPYSKDQLLLSRSLSMSGTM
mmetsp:Transcript_30750/g.36210  ORF Transcript_30750/g.36210 Transcript_30750/m.36210 type:complete len:180 (-) Transcript_30750:97-636(-)